MATLRQTSFAAGELSPRLWGRTDLELFGHGARRLRDFFITPQGAAVSRPGTQLLVEAKTADVVLVPFVFSDTVSYVLELGAGYLRVHHSVTGYTGIERATPYAAADLPGLQWAQVGGVLTLTHKNYPPKELLSSSWWLQDCRFGPPGDGATDPPMQAAFVKVDGSPAAVPHLTPEPATRPLTELFIVDAAHPPREWKWKVAALLQHSLTGELVESLPRTVTEYSNGLTTTTRAPLPADNLVVLSDDKPVRLKHPVFAAPIPKPANWAVVGLVWYRGRGELFGFIGTTRYAQDFIDTGVEPNYARQPLRGESPFTSDERPAAVAFFQQRRFFGGSLAHPSTLWGSATDDWGNHDRPFPPYFTDDAPLEASFVSRRREAIRSLVTHRRLLVLTDSSVWSAGGGDGAVTPASFEMRLEDEVGATKLQPLVVDGAVLYVRAKGRGVRALSLTDGGVYGAHDISAHAEHFFRGAQARIVSWCFQRDPWATIWAAQADGSLLSCCRTGESTWAWAKSTTGAGDKVVSVACVPEAGADVVVLAVKRGATTYLERMTTRDLETVLPIGDDAGDAAFALDCASSRLLAGVGVAEVVPGLSRFEGRTVWAVAPGNAPQGPLRVTAGSVTVGPFDTANRADGKVLVAIGLAFSPELETLDAVAAGRTTQKVTDSVGFEIESSGGGIEVGEDFSRLTAWRQRTPADSYDFPSSATGLAVVKVSGSWRRTGRAALRVSKPLPVTVLGLTRELDVGGS